VQRISVLPLGLGSLFLTLSSAERAGLLSRLPSGAGQGTWVIGFAQALLGAVRTTTEIFAKIDRNLMILF
jgi:hypothetical protein